MVKKCGEFCLALLLLFILVDFAVSTDSPATSPSSRPVSDADSPSLLPLSAPPVSGADSPSSPISSPPGKNADTPAPVEGPEVSSSPPAPLSGSPAPASSPSESPFNSPDKSPVPSPSEASDINHGDITSDDDQTDGSDGMSGGKKAGIAVGVIAAVCFVGFGGIVYKKRQENIRRTRYSYSARHEFL